MVTHVDPNDAVDSLLEAAHARARPGRWRGQSGSAASRDASALVHAHVVAHMQEPGRELRTGRQQR
jgi:hypothetical protein